MSHGNASASGSTGVQRVHRVYSYVLIVMFLTAITVPGFMLFWQSAKTVAVAEQRLLAPMPVTPQSMAEFQAYPSEFDAFVSNRFGFREWLVQQYNKMHIALNVSPSEKVIIGKDGWLFLEDRFGLLDQNRGALPFSEAELAEYISVLEQRDRYLAALNIPLVYLVLPEKQSIYQEFLPDWVRVVGQSRYQQFMETMRTRELAVADVYEPLLASKSQGADTYKKVDTHWNCRGAWIAYQQLVTTLADAGVGGMEVIPASGVIITDSPPEPGGDLAANMLHLKDTMLEHNNTHCTLKPSRKTLATPLATGKVSPWTGASPFNSEDWLYARADGIKVSRALVFRDSFAGALLPYLVNTFDEVIYTSHKGVSFDPSLIEKHQPTVVIYEFVERKLSSKIDNHKLASLWVSDRPARDLNPHPAAADNN